MGHMAAKQPYRRLRARLDRMPVGAPGRSTIYEILKTLFTSEEAELASRLPLRLASLATIARRLEMEPEHLRPRLEKMADKGLVLDFEIGGKLRYMLAPTIVGLFEFSMMRVREDVDQKELAGLFHRYLIEERDFADSFNPDAVTSPFRTLVHEEALPQSYAEVLDWERASYLVQNAGLWAVGLCHCRHVAHHLADDCSVFRLESCLTIGSGADYLVRHGLAREIERAEAQALLVETRDAGMVHVCDNVQRRPTFICNCCRCCCEILLGFKKFKLFGNTISSNFIAAVDPQACNGCKKCQQACPVDAIDLIERPRRLDGKQLKWLAQVDEEVCLGCGVCQLQCKFDSMKVVPRARRWITPENTFARVLTMALEQGKLHKLLVDDSDGLTARAAGALLGAILRLPPAKQLLARDGLKSRFVGFFLSRARKARLAGSDL